MNSTTLENHGQQTAKNTNLLINESPLYLIPSLATAIGLESAIIIQQIYFLTQNPKNGKVFPDGFRYIWNTYDDLIKNYFPFLSKKTLSRRIIQMENAGWLVAKHRRGSTKYYRVDFEKLQRIVEAFQKSQNARTGQIDRSAQDNLTVGNGNPTQIDRSRKDKLTVPYTKITTKSPKKTKKTTNISFASDDAEKFIPDKIALPESSLMALSGEVSVAEKSLHHQLMSLIESNIGKLTSSLAGKEARGAKEIREYIERNPDTTLQDVQDCLVWIQANQKWKQLSLTSVASQLPTYMTVKRKSGRVEGTIFKSAKERSDERLLNMDTKKVTENAQKVYDELKSIIDKKPITEIEKLVPGTQFKTAQEKSLEKMESRDFQEINIGATQIYESLAARIGKTRKV